MEPNYDEDLQCNVFFQYLQGENELLLARILSEGWHVCVPRAGTIPRYALSEDLLTAHILVPNDELPESHFRTLKDKEVKIYNRVILVEQEENEKPITNHILFEETYYNEDLLKYKVFCIEHPLETKLDFEPDSTTNLVSLQTLRDCIDLLWTESGSRHILEQMDESINVWIINNKTLDFKPLQQQRDQASNLYSKCLQFALQDLRLKEKASINHVFLDNIKIAVETYILHGIYKKTIKGISTCTGYEDASLNKKIRNLNDIQLRDLDIPNSLIESIPSAKQHLARIVQFSTVLGKMGCLKRAICSLGTKSADELLPTFVFLVLKTNIANWHAHLIFLKLFHFSTNSNSNDHSSHHMFLITTLEAAIDHIASGSLLGPSTAEADSVLERSEIDMSAFELNDIKSSHPGLSEFFKIVRNGDEEELKKVLHPQETLRSTEVPSSFLCHPLCVCSRCERLVSQALCDTTPTVHSCDDRGVTALHIACLYGHAQIVDLLITFGASVHATDFGGSNPLHYAASRGHQNALLLMLHAGTDISALDSDRNSALHLSAANGHEGCVKALLYYAEHVGVYLNTNIGNINGDTPLHHASRWGYANIVDILLEYEANPHVCNLRKLSPIDLSHNLYISRILTEKSKTVSQIYSKSNIDMNTPKTLDLEENGTLSSDSWSFCGQRPINCEQMKRVDKLLRAIALGDTPLACYYLGIDHPNNSESHNNTRQCHPLCTCYLCSQKNLEDSSEISTQATSPGIPIDTCNADGYTALHVAAMHGHVDLVSLLLDSGARLDIFSRKKGYTPLHEAVESQQASIVRLLLRSGRCDPDVKDVKGNTPLHLAACLGDARLIEVLLKASPDIKLKNKTGRTALDEAEQRTFLTVARLIRGRPFELSG